MTERDGAPARGRLARWKEFLLTSREELESQDERRDRLTDTTALETLSGSERHERSTFGGVLASVTYPAAGDSPILRARLRDGTGSLDLIFLGRRTVPGIEPGRRLRVSGTPTDEGSGPVMYNPTVELVDAVAEEDAHQ